LRVDGNTVTVVSIHAPRVGSDAWAGGNYVVTRSFNPRSPCGERRVAKLITRAPPRFQSTLPVWGATGYCSAVQSAFDVSIHAPRVGSDGGQAPVKGCALCFNPRSPCGERRRHRAYQVDVGLFQSTLPVWGATWAGGNYVVTRASFNPRSPCGERPAWGPVSLCWPLFQSTLPVWGATPRRDAVHTTAGFQSTLPVWGATRLGAGKSLLAAVSIHAPRVGSDAEKPINGQRHAVSIHAPRVGSDTRLTPTRDSV
jgi:hypothetical protein